mgnify:CR=1 FL=1
MQHHSDRLCAAIESSIEIGETNYRSLIELFGYSFLNANVFYPIYIHIYLTWNLTQRYSCSHHVRYFFTHRSREIDMGPGSTGPAEMYPRMQNRCNAPEYDERAWTLAVQSLSQITSVRTLL